MGVPIFHFSSKMEQTMDMPCYGSQEPLCKEKIQKKLFFTPFLDPLKIFALIDIATSESPLSSSVMRELESISFVIWSR
jgi:hypothetical protein